MAGTERAADEGGRVRRRGAGLALGVACCVLLIGYASAYLALRARFVSDGSYGSMRWCESGSPRFVTLTTCRCFTWCFALDHAISGRDYLLVQPDRAVHHLEPSWRGWEEIRF